MMGRCLIIVPATSRIQDVGIYKFKKLKKCVRKFYMQTLSDSMGKMVNFLNTRISHNVNLQIFLFYVRI